MAEQTVQSRDISVASVFHDFYVVPDYQREYVWDSEQVEQLLVDINSELSGADPVSAPEYFIGSVVVCAGTSPGTMDLIDGQQRMTTLFLVLCAIRDALAERGQSVPGALGPQISSVSTDPAGNDVFRYRMDLQYADSGDALVEIARGGRRSPRTDTTRSIRNIHNAYDVVQAFIRRDLAGDPIKIRAFYGYLTNRVKLIRIQTEDVAKALKIFETINDRGVGLDAMDLLKNLLFMKAERTEFDILKTIWKDMQDRLHAMQEKPLRFLRYFILSRYDEDLLREDEIYSWLSKHEAECGYKAHPVAFAKELLSAAIAYGNFLNGKDQQGGDNRVVENLRILGGKSARQHLIVLMAARHLAPDLFERVAREVEELFFVYVITREPTRDFERDFARWANEIRAAHDESSLTLLIDRRFAPAKQKLSGRFDDAFNRLYSFSVQGYRLRYILAKLIQHVELEAYGVTSANRSLSTYTSNAYEIEHIFPQGAGTAAKNEFGSHADGVIDQRLGNLTLVEKSINASLGNKPFSAKRMVYPRSQLLMTRAIGESQRVGVATKIDKAVANIETFTEWNEASVERRQKVIGVQARMTWNVPDSVGPT